ncbi:MAG: isoprenylcysteine carboxylmethyltransferase family protein [Pseudomonadota bacterium]|nr:isoprenylcysteine carboxylmethyltransferase family protein [Pseudomonadota bacterium]
MTLNRLELRVPPLAVAAVVAAGMYVTSLVSTDVRTLMPGQLVVAVLLGGAGLATAMAGVAAFRAHRTTVDPVHPDGATSIVSSGIYRISRNPMYLGFALMLSALAVQLESVLALLGVPLFVLYMNRFQIKPEERLLTAKFGAQYETYLGKVRRWI